MPPAADDLDPEIRGYLDEFESVNKDVEALVRDLTDEQLLWKPQTDKWSIAQCLDHLTVTARADLPHIRDTIQKGRATGLFGRGPFRYGFLGRWLTRMMDADPPVRMRFRAPRVYKPADNPSAGSVQDFFLTQQEVMNCIREANGLDLVRAKVSVPDRKFIKLSMGQEFALLAAHNRRHVRQAEEVKRRVAATQP
jgi:hypothetical protein